MRSYRCLVVLLAALTLAGCANWRPPWVAAPVQRQYSELDAMMYGAPLPPSATVRMVREVVPVVAPADGPYTLDSGDRLRIVVFGQDALSNIYIVDAAGEVALPLIGAVNARGLTTRELAASIKGRLANGYIREPSVAVEVDIYRPFFVLGEVTYPGQYPYVPNMTVENAIAIAGGFTPRGFKYTVAVTRRIQDVPARLTVPLRDLLCPGDTITVQERWF
jgi:polysaccharide export outer membrane protein